MIIEPFVIEWILNAPAAIVWQALTEKDKIKQRYFDIAGFKPEPGFEFTFQGQNEGRVFIHLCKITEVVPGHKLSHSWRYKGHEGDSLVTFELFPEGDKTKIKLTHSGLETFANSGPDFATGNFVAGWTHIIGTSLKDFVEKD